MATILVIDDDTVGRDSIVKTLERQGHTLEGASGVDQAIETIKRRQFDLVVCDYRMPGKSGLDFLVELGALGSHVPVLIVSAFADARTEAAARKLGAIGLLKKPFRRRELFAYAALALN
jgi:DNA-binding NtrC family response regulator